MTNKLSDRISSYQDLSNTKLLPRLPLIITVNGRSFSKLTSLLDKPFDTAFSECIVSTMLRLCHDVEGTIFAYQHNDEIVLIARNDQSPNTSPWYDNCVQKICSITSSLATLHFNRCAAAVNLNLMNEPLFISQVFVVPNMMEAINTLVYKQQYNFHTSIQFACFYELLKKYDKDTIRGMINGLTADEKSDLLLQECGASFNKYPIEFRRGVSCYKTSQMINGASKSKWAINNNLPIFTQDPSFLSNILKMGQNVFREGA